jgi:hypothetical protein
MKWAMDDEGSTGLEELSELLWQKRRGLERLLFGLAVARIVLHMDRSDWLPMAAADVSAVVDDIDRIEATCVRLLDREPRNLDVALTVSTLVTFVPAPWDEIFGEHDAELTRLNACVRALALATEASLAIFEESLAGRAGGSPADGDALSAEVLRVACDGLRHAAARVGVPAPLYDPA